MSDIRINALTTTATVSASDDYIGIDGSANGTRKLSAYSPTFGGNLTVTGALLAHQTAALNLAHEGSSLSQAVAYGADASTYGRFNVVLRKAGTGVGAITALSLNSTDATLAGNLTVSGGTIATGGGAAFTANGSTGKVTINGYSGGWQTWYGFNGSAGTFRGGFGGYGNSDALSYYFIGDSYNSNFAQFSSTATTLAGNLTVSGTYTGIAGLVNIGTGILDSEVLNLAASSDGVGLSLFSTKTGGKRYFIASSGGTSGYGQGKLVFGDETVGAYMALSNAGNLLIGTTTDGGQKLQVNGNSGFLGHIEIPADKHIYLKDGNPARWSSTGLSSGTLIADIYASSNSLYFRTNGATLALTLDSSQNTTAAGWVKATSFQISTDSQGTVLQSSGNTLFIDSSAGDVKVRPKNSVGNFIIANGAKLIVDASFTPASASATGTAGSITWDSSYIYVCTATNTWKRVAIATW